MTFLDGLIWSRLTRRRLLLAVSVIPSLATDALSQPTTNSTTVAPDPRAAARTRLENVKGLKLRGTEQIAMVLYHASACAGSRQCPQ
jgi:hypothetical protein